MSKFILPYNISSTPSPFGTAPVGHWGPYSPDPLRRSALGALSLLASRWTTSFSTLLGSGLLRKQYFRPGVKPQRPLDIRAEIFNFP